MSTVSILIPVYNRVGLLEETLRSAMVQKFSDIEILVIDNASNDGSFELARRVAEEDRRIRVYQNSSNVGPVRNWITAVELARSPYCKILFSDDLISEACVGRLLGKMLSSDVSLCYSPAIIGGSAWQGGLLYRAFDTECYMSREHFLRASIRVEGFAPVSPGAALFRTKDLRTNILQQVEGLEHHDFSASGAGVDWLVYALTALNYPKVAYVPDPLIFFRAHEGSITVSDSDNVRAGYAIVKDWFLRKVAGL